MSKFLTLDLFHFDSPIEVDGGWLHIQTQMGEVEDDGEYPDFEWIKFRLSLGILPRSTRWEDEGDRLIATIQIDDDTGQRWQAENEVATDVLWLDHAITDLKTDPSRLSFEWDGAFTDRLLLSDVYQISDSRWSKHYILGDEVVEIFEKYLTWHYDIAYGTNELYSGEIEPSGFLLIRLRLDRSNNNKEYVVYYWTRIDELLRTGPFRRAWKFRRIDEPGTPQPGVTFRKTLTDR